MNKLISIVLISILIISPAYAADTISSISGTVADGNTLTVNGTFTSKTQAAPLLWDDFEGGANGASLSGQSPQVGSATWYLYANDDGGCNYTNAVAFNGSQCAATLYRPISDAGQFDSVQYVYAASGTNTVYFSHVYRMDGNVANGIKKYTRIIGNSSTSYGACPLFTIQKGSGTPFATAVRTNDTASGNMNYLNPPVSGQWMRIEFYVDLGTEGNNDGTYRIWFDGDEFTYDYYHSDDLPNTSFNYWTSGYGYKFRKLMLGHMMANASTGVNMDFYSDDVYCDNTIQHVEIGDSITYASCNWREIQIPTAWSTSQIQVTLREGQHTFATDNLWVFVIDATGTASTGYALTSNPVEPDTTVPSITNKNPSPSSTGVSLDFDVSFNVEDYEVGVDLPTLELTVSGVNETSDISSSGDNSNYAITLAHADIDTTYNKGDVVAVEVSVDDADGNSASESWSFTLKDDTFDLGSESLELGGQELRFDL